MKSAVLVIDVQQELCEGPNAAFDCPGIIQRINKVTSHAREFGVPVIFIQHESQSDELLYKTEGWELAAGLEAKTNDHYVRKTTPDAFLKTELSEVLKQQQVTQLVVCGMHTEFCVDTTTRRALALGFPVTLVSDAHTSEGNSVLSAQQVIAHHNDTLTNVSSFGPQVTTVLSSEIELSN